MAEIRETRLPGVGFCHDFELGAGPRVGVVTRQSGRRELVVYDQDDPDAVSYRLDLKGEEATTLAELLADQTVKTNTGQIENLIEGLALDWVPVATDKAPASIGELEVRSRTGATIVAVVRDGRPTPAPGPEFELAAEDVAVVVGTPEGLRAAADLLGA
jgi:TrkA domain protein